jgi:hypothetical protein
MKEVKVIEIQSFNDIITNSSTEIYSSESNKNLLKTLDEIGIDYFNPNSFKDILDVIKRTVDKKFKDRSFLYDVELGINRTGSIEADRWGRGRLPKLTSDGYIELRKLGYCDEKIEEFFDPIYRACGVYGKVYIIYYNMCSLKEKFPGHERTANKFKSLGLD